MYADQAQHSATVIYCIIMYSIMYSTQCKSIFTVNTASTKHCPGAAVEH